MLDYLVLSGLGPHLARFRRRWLDKLENREFSELSARGKFNRADARRFRFDLPATIWLLTR